MKDLTCRMSILYSIYIVEYIYTHKKGNTGHILNLLAYFVTTDIICRKNGTIANKNKFTPTNNEYNNILFIIYLSFIKVIFFEHIKYKYR